MKRANLKTLLLEDFHVWVNSSNKTPDNLIDTMLHTLEVVGLLEALAKLEETKVY